MTPDGRKESADAMKVQAVAASAPETLDVAERGVSDGGEAAPPAPPPGWIDGEDG